MHAGQLAILPSHHMRTVPRRVVNFTAYVRETGARVVPVEVADLSTDGCKFGSDEPFETATLVWLKIIGVGARQVRIIWFKAGTYGCEFLHPLAFEVVDELCSKKERDLRKTLRAARGSFGRAGRQQLPAR